MNICDDPMIYIVRKRKKFANGSDKRGRHTMAYRDDLCHTAGEILIFYGKLFDLYISSDLITGIPFSVYTWRIWSNPPLDVLIHN